MFDIRNYYGGLEIKEEEGKYFWGIENYDGTEFEEIPKYLYDALIKYRDKDTQNKALETLAKQAQDLNLGYENR